MNLYTKQKQIHRCRKQILVIKGEKGSEEGQFRSMKLTDANYIKVVNNKNSLYSIGNYIQYLVIIYNGI